jgi:hypothetical protein
MHEATNRDEKDLGELLADVKHKTTALHRQLQKVHQHLALTYPAPVVVHQEDAELLHLYEELCRAWSAKFALGNVTTEQPFKEAMEHCDALVREIGQCSATTIHGIRVKDVVLQWCRISGSIHFESLAKSTIRPGRSNGSRA